jgi:hypothetical protein
LRSPLETPLALLTDVLSSFACGTPSPTSASGGRRYVRGGHANHHYADERTFPGLRAQRDRRGTRLLSGRVGQQRVVPSRHIPSPRWPRSPAYLDTERAEGADTDRIFLVLKGRTGRTVVGQGAREGPRRRPAPRRAGSRHLSRTRLREAGVALEGVQATWKHCWTPPAHRPAASCSRSRMRLLRLQHVAAHPLGQPPEWLPNHSVCLLT